jgi:phosphohistidine phosphatase
VILHLLRHAKSSWDDPVEDAERPLAPRGRRSARALARHLAERRVAPTLALCSPARRARQTLEIIRDALPEGMEERVEAWLYRGDADELTARLRRLPRAASEVLVVGHNPTLHDVALALAGASAPAQLVEALPTCGLVSLRVGGAGWRELGDRPAAVIETWRPRSDSNRRSPP